MRSMILSTTRIPVVFGASFMLFSGALASFSQAPVAPMGQPSTDDANQNKQMRDQLAELRSQVARLQATVEQTGSRTKSNPKSGMPKSAAKGMGMMGDGCGMGSMMPAMKDEQSETGRMAAGDANKMSAPAKAMGMCCMGEMGMPPAGSASMSAPPPPQGVAGMSSSSSATPGQSGASHLLHMGSTGFFLNHSQHITLMADQKSRLNRLKEKAMLDQASEQRQIDQAEQELYTVTGAEQPENSKIQAKITEIEKLRSQQRMDFIQAVGEASKVLTHDQHMALLGTLPESKQ